MILQTQREVEATREKLAELERLYSTIESDQFGAAYQRQLTLRSLRRTINQFQEDIARFESKSHAKS